MEDVNRLLKQFVQMRKMLKVMGGVGGGAKDGRGRSRMRRQLGQLRSMMGQ